MTYDARKKEVMDELDKTTQFDVAAKDAIRKVLDSYFSQRDGRLENLLELLEPRDEPCHSKWLEKTKEAAAGALDTLGRSEHGKLWLSKISIEEHTFFYELMLSLVPAKRDLMVAQTKALAKAETEFEQKWKTIVDGDKTIEERMHKIAQEYQELLDSAAASAAILEKESREAMFDKVRQALTVTLQKVDFGAVEYILKGGATAIGVKLNEIGSRKLEIHALISREEGIYATFKEGREMVKEFLKETSYPHVKDAYDAAEDAAEALAGEMLTSGQKDDANAYCSAIKYELAPVFRKAEDAYKSFARKHEYLFFGPLGGGYYQELLEDDTWKQFSKEWRESRRDIDELLRERNFVLNDNKILEVSLEGLSSNDRDIIHYTLQASCQELLRVWNRFKEVTNSPEWAIDSRETLKSVLDAMR